MRLLLAALVGLLLVGAGCTEPRKKSTWKTAPARTQPPPPPPKKRAPHHGAHEHPHGGHPHGADAHHHHAHPHPHLAGPRGHHHPY